MAEGTSPPLLLTEETRFFRELAAATGSKHRDVVRFFIALGIRAYYDGATAPPSTAPSPPKKKIRRRKAA